MKSLAVLAAAVASVAAFASPANAAVSQVDVVTLPLGNGVTATVKAPRDAASGQATGKSSIAIDEPGVLSCIDDEAQVKFEADGAYSASSQKCGVVILGDPDFDLLTVRPGVGDVDGDGTPEAYRESPTRASVKYKGTDTSATGTHVSFFDVFAD